MDIVKVDEELEILKAAKLVDSDAPEDLCTNRAYDFVGSKLGVKSGQNVTIQMSWFTRHKIFIWSGAALAFAVCAIAAVIFLPNSSSHMNGTPADVFEMQSVHASLEMVPDSVSKVTVDSTAIKTLVIDE
ncbi:MAG: hypothetical protein KBS55_01005 [Bacteroidales bacterium]|nr:hypothetical protein [Candidatus Cryptobacteroides aphodequi]